MPRGLSKKARVDRIVKTLVVAATRRFKTQVAGSATVVITSPLARGTVRVAPSSDRRYAVVDMERGSYVCSQCPATHATTAVSLRQLGHRCSLVLCDSCALASI